jgi:hypothetical protein
LCYSTRVPGSSSRVLYFSVARETRGNKTWVPVPGTVYWYTILIQYIPGTVHTRYTSTYILIRQYQVPGGEGLSISAKPKSKSILIQSISERDRFIFVRKITSPYQYQGQLHTVLTNSNLHEVANWGQLHYLPQIDRGALQRPSPS